MGLYVGTTGGQLWASRDEGARWICLARDLPEIYALENGSLRALSNHNGGWLGSIALGETRDVQYKTRDGAEVHGLLTLPPSYTAGEKLRSLIADYPVAALLIAGAAGYLIGRTLHDRRQ